MRLLLAAIAALAVSTTALAEPLPDPLPVVAAERAFAAETGRIGIERGFLKFSTDDAINIGGAVVRVHEAFDSNAAEAPPSPMLFWFPLWAGISRSGDLGFTSGPVEIGGRRGLTYFTVWQKQPDGGWKWIYDGGVGATSAGDPGPETAPAFLSSDSVGSASPQVALAEVAGVEAALAVKAATDQKAALLAVFAPDGRAHVAPFAPASTPAAVAEQLGSYPAAIRFAPLGGTSSQAGDLVWTYGTAAWNRDGAEAKGHYVRIWQKRADGWKLVFAQIVPAR